MDKLLSIVKRIKRQLAEVSDTQTGDYDIDEDRKESPCRS